jgi:pimeloyl-ACP methyl ester carboxylesterase
MAASRPVAACAVLLAVRNLPFVRRPNFGIPRAQYFLNNACMTYSLAWPIRREGAILIAPTAPFGPNNPSRNPTSFLAEQVAHDGWGKFNKHYWLKNYDDFLAFFFGRMFAEPHSTKQIEDGVSWGAEIGPEGLVDTIMGRFESAHEEGEEVYREIRCPVIVIHGDQDDVIPHAKRERVAELLGAPLLTIEQSTCE